MGSSWLQHALALLLAAAVPVWDRVETRRVKRSTDPRAKMQSYRRVVGVLWGLTAVALAAVPLPDLVRPPALGGAAARLTAVPVETLVGFLVPLLLGLAAPVLAARLNPRVRARLAGAMAPLSWYLPNSPAERRWWVALSVSAGVCEEVLYRGFLVRYLAGGMAAHPLLGLGGTGAVLAAALVFALAHTYQGPAAAAGTALMAVGLTVLFVASGSLWLPMLVHVLVDLRLLLLWRGDSGASVAAAPARSAG